MKSKKTKSKYMIIGIQPQELGNGTLPYPYFIDKKGKIGRQDFWKGRPYILLGFNCKCVVGEMDIYFKDFWKDPKLAIGKYPVFSDKKGNWFTSKTKIESINKIK